MDWWWPIIHGPWWPPLVVGVLCGVGAYSAWATGTVIEKGSLLAAAGGMLAVAVARVVVRRRGRKGPS